jgi:hypothetical protein
MGDRRGLCRVLAGEPEGIFFFFFFWHRWKNNIKMDLQELECGDMG